MNIIWSKKLEYENMAGYMLGGAFRRNGDVLTFYRWGWDDDFTEMELCAESGEVLSLKNEGREKQKELKALYGDPNDPKHYYYDDFVFGEYTVSHHGQWGYACHKNGRLMWKRSLKAWLYTDIERYGDLIVLGTAGQGGHFYGLEIETGEVRFDFNTRGTSRFFFCGGCFIFFSHEKSNRTRLLKVLPSGEVLGSLEIDGYVNDDDCPGNIIDGRLYTAAKKYRKKDGEEFFSPIVYCIEIL